MAGKRFGVIVVGAGQSGLATGHQLARWGVDFVILDGAERVGESWRRRWDSLRLFTPARYDGLPGMAFPASPTYFPTKDEMAAYLEEYARHFALPVRLGAEVTRLCAAPDGRNVNLGCGSTAPEAVAAAVVAAGAHLGAAFDGDADRCILADERGEVRDGDAILYLWATRLLAERRLVPPAIVATSMSNLGLELALARQGISVVRCGVGDRLVVETMRREGIGLGGEQSGHVVRLELAATGDGLLTAVQMAALVHQAGRPLSELLAGFKVWIHRMKVK